MTEKAARTEMATKDFDPSKHLRKLRGRGGESDYLDVRWRIVWFRDRFPAGEIATVHIQIGESHAVFRATVTAIGEGGEVCGRATGYGSETAKDFGDFIEKAETKAVGRALAALGFGTQFTQDLDEGERIADAPADNVARNNNQPARATTPAKLPEQQRKRLEAVAKERGLRHEDWKALAVAWFNVQSTSELTPEQATRLEEWLKSAKPEAMTKALYKAGVDWLPSKEPDLSPSTADEVNTFLAGYEPGEPPTNPDRYTN